MTSTCCRHRKGLLFSIGWLGFKTFTHLVDVYGYLIFVACAMQEPKGFFSLFTIRPELRRDYPLNLSILISGGRETNKDSLSNGE